MESKKCVDCGDTFSTKNRFNYSIRCAACNEKWWKPALDELENDPSLTEEERAW